VRLNFALAEGGAQIIPYAFTPPINLLSSSNHSRKSAKALFGAHDGRFVGFTRHIAALECWELGQIAAVVLQTPRQFPRTVKWPSAHNGTARKPSPLFTVTVMFTGAFVISCTSLGRQVLEFSILI
jgi:hypothetical protein